MNKPTRAKTLTITISMPARIIDGIADKARASTPRLTRNALIEEIMRQVVDGELAIQLAPSVN